MEVDDLLCEASDAVFEANYELAVEKASLVCFIYIFTLIF